MKLRTAILWLGLSATVIAGLMVAAAWQHNPQGEFRDEGRIHYSSLSVVFFTWWGLIVACGSPLIYLQQWMRCRRSDE